MSTKRFLCGLFVLSALVGHAQPFNWSSMPAGQEINGPISHLTVYKNTLIAAGNFTRAGGVQVNNIAAWDGQTWSPLGQGVYARNLGHPNIRFCYTYKNWLIVAGSFDSAGTVASKNIAAWDGTQWLSLGGTDYYGYIISMCTFNNELFVVGNFDTIAGLPANNMARWNGSTWLTNWDTSYTFGTIGSALEYNNELVLIGYASPQGTSDIYGITGWDGTQWKKFPQNLEKVGGSTVLWNNKIINGFLLTFINGKYQYTINQWDGTQWKLFSISPSGTVGWLFQFNNNLYVTGSAKNTTDTTTNVWLWDSTTNIWQGVGSGINNVTYALCMYNNVMYCGGSFNKTETGAKHNYLARYTQQTGLNEKDLFKVEIFPNPATQRFTITTPLVQTQLHLTLTDMSGRIVYQGKQHTNIQGQVELAAPSQAGIYWCKITAGDKVAVQKLCVFND